MTFFRNSDPTQITNRTITDPTFLDAGYLHFSDREHLTDYYAYLVSIADTATDLHITLESLIKNLGHQSLYFSDTAAFDNPSRVALTDASIVDPLRKVLLNMDYEVAIGDSLFVFQNRWQTYSFPVGDIEARDSLRATPKGTALANEKYTNGIRLVDSDEDVITNRSLFCTQFNSVFRSSPCTHPLKVEVVGASQGVGIPISFTMDIDWGDGSSTIDNNNLGFETFTHTYATSGNYTIVSELSTSCLGPILLTTVSDVSVGGSCDFSKKVLSEFTSSGDIGMISEIWTANDPFGCHSGSKTTCYEFINSKWRERKGIVSAFVDSDFREAQCDIEDNDNETDSCGNCKFKRASVPSAVANKFHQTGDVTSIHSITRNSVTLNNSLELEFDCN